MERVSDAGMHWHRTSTREDASVSPPRGTGTLLAAAAIALFATSDARTCSWTSLHEAMGFHLGCLGLFAPTLEMLGIRTAVDGYDFLLEK